MTAVLGLDRTKIDGSFAEFFSAMDPTTREAIVSRVVEGVIRFPLMIDLHLPLYPFSPECQEELRKEWQTPCLREAYLAMSEKNQLVRLHYMLREQIWSAEVMSYFRMAGSWRLPLIAFMDSRVMQLTWRPHQSKMCGVLG